MHNGGLGSYDDVIRPLRDELDEETLLGIRGSTDSEHAFALVQDVLGEDAVDPGVEDLAGALAESLAILERLTHEHGDPAATRRPSRRGTSPSPVSAPWRRDRSSRAPGRGYPRRR